MKDQIKINQIYQHYKGKNYRVLGLTVHSETLEDLVLYECLYENELSKLWVRPLQNFLEVIEIEGTSRPRFKLLEDEAKVSV